MFSLTAEEEEILLKCVALWRRISVWTYADWDDVVGLIEDELVDYRPGRVDAAIAPTSLGIDVAREIEENRLRISEYEISSGLKLNSKLEDTMTQLNSAHDEYAKSCAALEAAVARKNRAAAALGEAYAESTDVQEVASPKAPKSAEKPKAAPTNGAARNVPMPAKVKRSPNGERKKQVVIPFEPVTDENVEKVLGALGTDLIGEAEIRAACGFSGRATAILKQLVEDGKVVVVGAKRGTKYRLA